MESQAIKKIVYEGFIKQFLSEKEKKDFEKKHFAMTVKKKDVKPVRS